MSTVVTLTTDFGTSDAYVATMKGVILSINPEATIVDVCHSIESQNIAQAAFVLSTAYPFFPQDTIHIVVVDPGVGSQRRAVILKTPLAYFVAPDNGVLSYIIGVSGTEAELKQRELPPDFQAVSLNNPRFWRSSISATFHGRDIFAPVAAYLSLGVPLEELGEPIPTLLAFPVSRPHMRSGGELLGHILHIDHFGNLITDIKQTDLPSEKMLVEIGGHWIEGLSSSYAESSDLLAILGSSGNLEIAAKNRNAAELLGAKVGDTINLKKG